MDDELPRDLGERAENRPVLVVGEDLVPERGDLLLLERFEDVVRGDRQVQETANRRAVLQGASLIEREGTHAAHHVGATVDLVGAVSDARADLGVVLVLKVGLEARVALDVDLVAEMSQLRHGVGGQPDPVLCAMTFFRDAEDHGGLLLQVASRGSFSRKWY